MRNFVVAVAALVCASWLGGVQPDGLCQGGTIYLDPEAAGLALPGLAAHEMGHCVLDFADDEDPDAVGIMRVVTETMLWTNREEGQCAASPRCVR